jgi:hypothetical protein
LGVVGEPADPAGRVKVGVEGAFGDVHADRLGYAIGHLCRVLCLSSGPRAPGYPFRQPGKREGRSHSSSALTASNSPTRPLPLPAGGRPQMAAHLGRTGHGGHRQAVPDEVDPLRIVPSPRPRGKIALVSWMRATLSGRGSHSAISSYRCCSAGSRPHPRAGAAACHGGWNALTVRRRSASFRLPSRPSSVL